MANAMLSRVRVSRLLARLLLSLAVLTCVLGASGSAGPAYAGASGPAVPAVLAYDAHAGHTAAADPAVRPAPPGSDGHGGHGDGSGAHLIGCMIAAGVLALTLLIVLSLGGPRTCRASVRRLHGRVRAGLQARPPDLAVLCIQRI